MNITFFAALFDLAGLELQTLSYIGSAHAQQSNTSRKQNHGSLPAKTIIPLNIQLTPQDTIKLEPGRQQKAGKDKQDEFCQLLLSSYPDGGKELVSEVSTLVIAAPEITSDLLGCVADANRAQVTAIGAVLAKAVLALNENDPENAAKIATLVAGSRNLVLKVAFLKNVGDQTAAIPEAKPDPTPAPAVDTTPVQIQNPQSEAKTEPVTTSVSTPSTPSVPDVPSPTGDLALAEPSGPPVSALSVSSSGNNTGGGGLVSPN